MSSRLAIAYPQSMRKPRGRSAALLAGTGVLAILAPLVIFHDEVAIGYHLFRLRVEPAYIRQLVVAEKGTWASRALDRFLETPAGGRVLFSFYIGGPGNDVMAAHVRGEPLCDEAGAAQERLAKYIRTEEGRGDLRRAYLEEAFRLGSDEVGRRLPETLGPGETANFVLRKGVFSAWVSGAGLFDAASVRPVPDGSPLLAFFPFFDRVESGNWYILSIPEYPEFEFSVSASDAFIAFSVRRPHDENARRR